MTLVTAKVLLVDEFLEERETYRDYLIEDKKHKYKILDASTGEEAILLCWQQFLDVIVINYRLPDMDGMAFLKELKMHFGKTNLPVIILTEHENEKIARKMMKEGAADYLVKNNVSKFQFIKAVENVLEKTRLTQQLLELEKKAQERNNALQEANQELQITLEELQVAEEELRSSNEELIISRQAIELERQLYQDLFEFAPDGYLVTDTWGNITEANRTAAALLCLQQQRLIGKPLFVFIPKLDRKAFLTRLTKLQEVQDWEVYLKPRSGEPFPVMLALSSIYDTNGQQVGWRWLLRDISTRKQMEQRLQAAHEQLEKQAASDHKQAQETIREQATLLDVATDAIFVRDLEHRILYWNLGAERLYGWQAEEVLGRSCREFVSNQILSKLEEAFREIVEQGEWQGELNKITKSGQEIIVQSRWTLMLDETGQAKSILCVDTDITEKKQLEAQFYRAQRLESLGTLASGIAHDMNNILAPIMAIAQLLPMRLPNLNEKNQKLLRILVDSSKRGAQLVKQIMSFAKGEEGKQIPLQPRHLFNELEQIVKSTFPKSIEISIQISTANLWIISADPTQIHQVLMNLCVNARDAMPNGGKLTIFAENFHVNDDYARINLDAKVGNYVMITVSDTGCGMSQEVKERIFEPFFTTKEQGKGTGLGLSTTIGIIKNHGGFINVQSKVGEGSQFQVFLPAIDTEEIEEADDSQIVRGNGELILVVDDEVFIREIAKTSLEELNYRVMIASDGIEAFSLYAQHQNEISLVLMDIQMPSIDGVNAIRVLQQMNPQVKIIVISGLISNRQLLEASKISVQAFLLKPYTINDLLRTIKSVLSS
jgi:PAS domain S-box-containing protein